MHIEIAAPAILPLAFGIIEGDKAVVLGAAMQHPPTHFLSAKHREMSAYGPRAHIVREVADQITKKRNYSQPTEFRIENTTPSLVGFGGDANLALSTAISVAWTNEDPADANDIDVVTKLAADAAPELVDPLSLWGLVSGGMLLVDINGDQAGSTPKPPIKRIELSHQEHEAWAFVFHYPHIPAGTSEALEQERWALIKEAAPQSPPETGDIILNELWPALQDDDLDRFCQGFARLRQLNIETLTATGNYPAPSEHAEKLFALFRDEGLVAYGESYTGYGIFSLMRGSLLSQQLRKRMLHEIGYDGGVYSATVVDNKGLKYKIKDENLHLHDYQLPNSVEGVSGPRRKR